MSDDLERRDDAPLAVVENEPQRDFGAFDVLDIYEAGVAPASTRIEALATISAGRLNAKGYPERSADGTIYLHDAEGRAPGLAAALAATGGKSLTIAFPFDDPRQFIQQRFVQYSKTRLLAYGDQFAVTVIGDKGERTEYSATEHPDDYRAAVLNCKTAFSVYFVLVEWHDGKSLIVMPDGMGFYRIRFTGRNSARSFMSQLALLAKFTTGRLAGIPFDLRITNREVADPTGVKRTVPVFVPTMRAPGMNLSSENFRGVLRQGLGQADRLQLAAPSPETIDDAATEAAPIDLDGPMMETETLTPAGPQTRLDDDGRIIDVETGEIVDEVEPTEHDIARLQSPLDYDAERARFFAIVKGTMFDDDQARADLLREAFDGDSLRDLLVVVDPAEWDAFLGHVEELVKIEEARAIDAEHQAYGDGVTEAHVRWLGEQLRRLERTGFEYPERRGLLAWLLGRSIGGNADITAEDFSTLKDRLGTTRGSKFTPLTAKEADALIDEWRDAAVEEALG